MQARVSTRITLERRYARPNRAVELSEAKVATEWPCVAQRVGDPETLFVVLPARCGPAMTGS